MKDISLVMITFLLLLSIAFIFEVTTNEEKSYDIEYEIIYESTTTIFNDLDLLDIDKTRGEKF